MDCGKTYSCSYHYFPVLALNEAIMGLWVRHSWFMGHNHAYTATMMHKQSDQTFLSQVLVAGSLPTDVNAMLGIKISCLEVMQHIIRSAFLQRSHKGDPLSHKESNPESVSVRSTVT